jgi:hypothetical protein
MNLREKACLVNLKISQWTARRLDKKATRDVCEIEGTTEAWTKATKSLLSESATKPIAKLANEARLYHYSVTLPWDDNGARILPTAVYLDYVERMNQYKAKFSAMVGALAADYQRLIAEAQGALNGLFNRDDYPADIRCKYDLRTQVRPIPAGDDLRIDIDSADLARLRTEIEADVSAQVAESVKDLWARLRKVISCAADALGDKDKVFRDSLITNISDLCAILPKLNITGDARLDAMAQDVWTALASRQPQTLRDNPDLRRRTADSAKAALAKVDTVMGTIA